MANKELKLFKQELKELLERYEACINVDYADCSDMHGVYGEAMIVEIKGKTYKICDDWRITPYHLK